MTASPLKEQETLDGAAWVLSVVIFGAVVLPFVVGWLIWWMTC